MTNGKNLKKAVEEVKKAPRVDSMTNAELLDELAKQLELGDASKGK